MKVKLSKAIARKVLEVVDAGLVNGLGSAVPGKMCVEAAVCYALGEPHGDNPSCVGAAVREFKIQLNDANWSSDAARTKGMRAIAIAQLGSNEIDQKAFSKEVAFQTIKQIVPIALRVVGPMIPEHKDALETAAVACETAKDIDAAYAVARAAANAARAAAYAAYAAYAAADASRAAYAAARAAYAAAAYAAAARAARAADAAYAAARAADAAYAAADAARDEILSLSAEIGLKALKKLKSEGCKWLDLVS